MIFAVTNNTYVPMLKGVILLSLICYKWVQCCLLIFPMEALDFILNYVGVVFGKVSSNDFFHWCRGSFEFFHIPTLAFGCVAMAGQFEHLSTQVSMKSSLDSVIVTNRPFPPTFAIWRKRQKLRYWVGLFYVLSLPLKIAFGTIRNCRLPLH